MTLKRIKMIADLDEEKLLAEAMFDTACEGLDKEDYDIDIPRSDENYENILPRSKVQFPIRRRRWTRCRKLLCLVLNLAFGLGVLGTTYSLLKSNTVSLDLKLVSGQTLQYKLKQESSFEGAKLARSSFTEDVIVQVVNKTGNQYWLKMNMNSVPHSAKHKLVFLVQVNLAGQKTMDIAGEKRFRVFSNSKESEQVDYYVYNLLKQLLPVVKIDQFEMILSQLTTRTHQRTVHDTALFPGTATMQQTIRSVQGQILVSSKITPDGFSVFSKARRDLPFISLSVEEDVSISKSTGMLQTSDMELSAKILLGGTNDGPAVVMRFKSSLNFVKETSLSTPDKFETDGLVELTEIWSNDETWLKYFPPAYKRYDEQSNAINKVKQMLNLTKAEHFKQEEKPAHDRHMLEFANSFHKIVLPGQQSHFAAVEGEKTERQSAGDKPHKHMGHVDPEDDGFKRKRDDTAAVNGRSERPPSSGHEANGNQDKNNNTAIQQTNKNPAHDSRLLNSKGTMEAKNAKSKNNEKPSSKKTTKSNTNKNTSSKKHPNKPTNTEEKEDVDDDEMSPTSPDDHEENFFNQMFNQVWEDDDDEDNDDDENEFKFPPLPFGFSSYNIEGKITEF